MIETTGKNWESTKKKAWEGDLVLKWYGEHPISKYKTKQKNTTNKAVIHFNAYTF